MRNVGRVTFTITGSSHMNYVIFFSSIIVSNLEYVIYFILVLYIIIECWSFVNIETMTYSLVCVCHMCQCVCV